MYGLIYYPLFILASLLLADFITGVGHWFEDTYLDSSSLSFFYFKKVALWNELHHRDPAAFTLHHPISNLYTSLPIYFVLLIICPYSLFLYSTLTIALLGNLVHRWCHTKPPFIINQLQKIGILQRPLHHKIHHYKENSHTTKQEPGTYYCVLTNVMNPTLEYFQFWRNVERIISVVIGVQPLWER